MRGPVGLSTVDGPRSSDPLWDGTAPCGGPDSLPHAQRVARVLAVLEAIGPPPPARVLDVGCGGGAIALRLAARGFRVDAVDVREDVIGPLQGRVAARVAAAEQLPFADGAFDVALAIGLLLWLPEPEVALAELGRVVRPGGLALVTLMNAGPIDRVLDPARRVVGRHLPGMWRCTPRQAAELLGRARLDLVDEATWGFPRMGPLRRSLEVLAERGVPVVRSSGAQSLLAARRSAWPAATGFQRRSR